jgi:glycosyltransferase involved in cell wall biosynthesis
MRILNVIDVVNPASGGGATERSCQMSRYLALAGEHVDILTTKWDLDIEYMTKLTGVNCHELNALYFRYLIPVGAKKWLQQNIANYEIVHLSKNWSLLTHMASVAAASKKIPFVFSSMGFVGIYNRSQMLKRIYRKFVTTPMIKKASACIGVTREETTDLIHAGASPEKVHLIPNGIIPEDFLHQDNDHFRRQHKLDDRKIILFIGRMDPIKGVHLIIDAFERNRTKLKNWLLLLVGTKTAYRKEMEKKVEKLGLQNSILFLDPLFGKQKSAAYHAAEFVVIPSIKDAMTIIAPEAACCAKPVLITKTSDFGELALCGGAIEVEPSIDDLSYGLSFLTSDNCDRVDMGRKGYDYVIKKFIWEKVAMKYWELFQTVSASAKN